LSYFQIGLLLSIPGIISSSIEPFIGILADLGKRKVLILTGGVIFAASLVITSLSTGFVVLLLSFILFYPASGAFVSLSQTALMDANPSRREKNMARWTFVGSLGVVCGPIFLGLTNILGLGWRGAFLGSAVITVPLIVFAQRLGKQISSEQSHQQAGLMSGLMDALGALRRREVLRWLVLLEFSDLMLDVLLGFLALYFVDVAGATPQQAGVAVAIWSGAGLLGDFLLIPLLDKVSGLSYLRASALLELVLLPAFLLMPNLNTKLVLLGLLGFFNAGWYAILKANLYEVLPGRSGTALALNNITGLLGGFLPIILGWVAQRYNLQLTMWFLLFGPLALIVGIPYSWERR
ncbi:MAG TPA: MFS transporter, partial [Anaerolineales bacterium]|nr:MFS transporter [Anaerolineales bacterium]